MLIDKNVDGDIERFKLPPQRTNRLLGRWLGLVLVEIEREMGGNLHAGLPGLCGDGGGDVAQAILEGGRGDLAHGQDHLGKIRGQGMGGVDRVIDLRPVPGEVCLVGIRNANLQLMKGVGLGGVLVAHVGVGAPGSEEQVAQHARPDDQDGDETGQKFIFPNPVHCAAMPSFNSTSSS